MQTWSFPTAERRAEYLATVSARAEADVLALLRVFLFEESSFGLDGDHLDGALRSSSVRQALDGFPLEYSRRLTRWLAGNAKPHPSIRWVLDLLPHAPQQAIDAVMGYLDVYRSLRPTGRSEGLLDAAAIIRARWIEDVSDGIEALFRLSPRDFEALVAALYRKIGYQVELTPPSRDGGRDVIATRAQPGRREVVEVECKTHSSPIGVKHVRQLCGVVEMSRASRGVLVAAGRFTRGARAEAAVDSRLELIDGESLIRLLNASFGPLWFEDHRWISRALGSERRWLDDPDT